MSYGLKSEENDKLNKNKTKTKGERKEDGYDERGKTVRVTVIYSVIIVIIVERAKRSRLVQTIREEARHRRRDQRRQHGLRWLERLDGGHIEEDHLALLRLRAPETNLRGDLGQQNVIVVILQVVVRLEVRVHCGLCREVRNRETVNSADTPNPNTSQLLITKQKGDCVLLFVYILLMEHKL